MKLCDIKNLTASELKERREELTKLAGGNECAAAFIQSLTDAKLRDEKLAEQGVTISRLNDALGMSAENVAKAQTLIAETTAALDKERADRSKECQCHAEACGKLKASIDELSSKLTAETARANRLAALCARSEKFINAVVAGGNELIAARMVEVTNEG